MQDLWHGDQERGLRRMQQAIRKMHLQEEIVKFQAERDPKGTSTRALRLPRCMTLQKLPEVEWYELQGRKSFFRERPFHRPIDPCPAVFLQRQRGCHPNFVR